MSRRRYLSTNASRDKALNQVAMASDFTALFYVLAIPHAGDDARLPTNDPEELLYEVCPGRRDKTPDDVAAAVHALIKAALFVYHDDGALGFPAASFYRYQTYIREERRGSAQCAPDSAEERPSAHNSADQRTSAQNSASFTFNPSFTESLSSEATPLQRDSAPSAVEHGSGALVESSALIPVSVVAAQPSTRRRPQITLTSEHHLLWSAFDAIFGDAVTDPEKAQRGKACKLAARARASPDDLRLAAEHWPNVMGSMHMSEMGIVSRLGKLLHGPQVNGRDAGTVRAHTQRLTEVATVRRESDTTARLNARAAQRGHLSHDDAS